MTANQQRPSWVIGWALDASKFDCCGNQDPFPFKCEFCSHPYVVCCECDTLFSGLPDTTVRYFSDWNEWRCSNCDELFAQNFMASDGYRIGFDDWNKNGLKDLLAVPPMAELLSRFVASTNQLASYLQRGMRSSARGWSFHLVNFAGALETSVVGAAAARKEGFNTAMTGSLGDAVAYCDTITNSQLRGFAIVGVADSIDRKHKNGT